MGARDINLGPGIAIPADAATARWGILGNSGSGKSNVEAVLAEELWRLGIPFAVIDPKGDWWGIRYGQDDKGPGLPIPILGGLHGDIPLEPTAGALVADLLVDQNVSAVIDISRFTEREKREFLVAFCHRLFDRHQADPHVRHIIFEEAHRYIPQSVTSATADLKEATAKIALEGRVFGLGNTAASQRSSRIHKDVLTQWEILIAMRSPQKLDREAIGGWVEEHPEVGRELLPTLDTLSPGEGWLLAPQLLGRRDRVRFRRRSTYDSGEAPKVGQRKVSPRGIADIDLSGIKEAMAETIERADRDNPEKLRQRIRQAEADKDRAVRQLQAQLDRVTEELTAAQAQRVPEPFVPPDIRTGIAGALDRLKALNGVARELADVRVDVERLMENIDAVVAEAAERARVSRPVATLQGPEPEPRAQRPSSGAPKPVAAGRDVPRPVAATPDESIELSDYARTLLGAIAGAHPHPMTTRRLEATTGRSSGSSLWRPAVLELVRAGLITDNRHTDHYKATEAGCIAAGIEQREPVTREEYFRYWTEGLTASTKRMGQELMAVWPESLSREEISERARISMTSSLLGQGVTDLVRAGLAERVSNGHVRATDELMTLPQ